MFCFHTMSQLILFSYNESIYCLLSNNESTYCVSFAKRKKSNPMFCFNTMSHDFAPPLPLSHTHTLRAGDHSRGAAAQGANSYSFCNRSRSISKYGTPTTLSDTHTLSPPLPLLARTPHTQPLLFLSVSCSLPRVLDWVRVFLTSFTRSQSVCTSQYIAVCTSQY